MRLCVFTLLFSLVAAFHTAIPTQAEAASALFRVKRSWSGPTSNGTTSGPVTYTSPDFHPRTMGPSKAPPASGIVAIGVWPTPEFTVPKAVIKDIGGTKTCFPFGCNPPVVSSSVMNSYWNAKGSFGPNNGPTKYHRLYPPTSTTTFNGNYDFSRSGRIVIDPGVNRFGGTLRMLAGAEVSGYKELYFSPAYYRQYGAGTLPVYLFTSIHYGVPLPSAYRYKMTEYGSNKETTGTPYSPGDYYVQKVMYIPSRSGHLTDFRMKFTTGWVNVFSTTYWRYVSATGYDNRTSMGLKGNISMVRPRLVHSYVVPHDPNLPIRKERTFARIDRITVHFLPEPGVNAMLAAGLMGLVGLYRLRRR